MAKVTGGATQALTWFLVLGTGTFLPPNGSISNITGWKLVDPTSGEIPHFCSFHKSGNPLNEVQNSRDVLFLKKEPPAGQNRDNEDWRTELVYTWIQISRYPDIQISRYPDIQISRCPDVQMSRYQVSDTTSQVSEKQWKKKSPKLKNDIQRIGQIEAMVHWTSPET